MSRSDLRQMEVVVGVIGTAETPVGTRGVHEARVVPQRITVVIGDVERVFAPWPKLGAPVPGKKNPVVQLADSVRAYLPWG